jgi:putative peptidoglycan lipid II flippase
LNWLFARRAGTRYHFILDWRDQGLREWVRLSLPLMAGVSLVTADNWIIAHFASRIGGAVSLMSYAKQVFTAPMSILAQAAGAASMPFFASLWTRDRHYEFATGVADSVSRVASLGLLAASGMIALGWPAIDLVFTGGRFSAADARECAVYFAVFSVSMFLWAAQAIYARAFYATGNTFVPMVASTIVTVVSLPIYSLFFHRYGATGLALASDIGIAMQTLTIAVLLHKRRMVSLASLDFAEIGRCLLAAFAGGAVTWLLAWGLDGLFRHLPGIALVHHAHYYADAAILIAGAVLWTVIAKWVLEKAGSALPKVAMRRLRMG